jgi:hypothetical protein
MKKKYLSVALVLTLCGSMLTTSCVGNFALSNKILAWNKTVGNKFVNELVFFAFWVVPVYEISLFADVVVFNSIEFWSGNNPIAAGTKVIDGQDGRYIVKCDKKGYTITSENDKSVVRLDFDEADRSWSVKVNEGESYKLMTFVDDNHVKMITPDGSMRVVELSQAGVYAYQQIATNQLYAAK